MNYTKTNLSFLVKTQTETEITNNILPELEAKETLHGEGILIPFHAIDYVEVTRTSESATRPDPICGESGGNALQDENGNDLTDENGTVIEGE